MPKTLLTSLILFTSALGISNKLHAQENLVPNGSFENFSQCPDNGNQLDLVTNWFNPTTASPDYNNACDASDNVGVPNNFFGFQSALTGQGYAGIGVAKYFGVREYVEIRLTNPLEAGKEYCVEFFVSLADSVNFATDNLGAYFSTDSISENNPDPLLFTAQIKSTAGTFLTDKDDWQLIEGSFTAQGGEEYLTIGNFDTENVLFVDGGDTTDLNYAGSYYYLDDVSVKLSSCTNAVNDYSIEQWLRYQSNGVYQFSSANHKIASLSAYDIAGNPIYYTENISDPIVIDLRTRPTGIIILTVQEKDKITSFKFFHQNN